MVRETDRLPASAADPVAALAAGRFGIAWLHPLQRLVIANVLEAASGAATGDAGEDGPPPRQIVILPTGAGKSLCFQLPALLLDGPTLVLYPLLALMEDQKRRLSGAGVEAAVFRGGQTRDERGEALEGLASGRVKLALANPEVLARGPLAEALARIGIAHLAIDEAHCVAQWGPAFRPAYLEMGRIAGVLKPRAFTAFTATAGPELLEATARSLFGELPWRLVAGNPDRPNIAYAVIPTLSREHSLLSLLRDAERPLIVFASSRRGVEGLARVLTEEGFGPELRFYHAGLEAGEKRKVEAWFLGSGEGILVATCAYGMGVDKRDIRTVIHWELPACVEAYLQESGRAGRDGGPARALLLAGTEEEKRLTRGGEGEGGRRALLGYARSGEGCRREALLSLLGTRLDGPCSGCDRCGGHASTGFEGAAEILGFFGHNPRRFDRAEGIERLAGKRGFDPPLVAGSGSLRGWRRGDIARAIEALVDLGRLRERRSWPWKGAMEVR